METLAASPGPLVIFSCLLNPYLNLALETYFFQSRPIDDLLKNISNNRLFVYSNSPCIVFGKNQNPWKEVNFEYLRQKNLEYEVLRRYSGGGAVIHGQGNVNYGFISSKKEFDRTLFSNIIVEELNEIYSRFEDKTSALCPSFPIKVNERGDLVAITEGSEHKISGSAYKISKGKSYHHGTMLLNCNLDGFKNILSPKGSLENLIVDKSVDSKRASVVNLEMDEIVFSYCLARGFIKKYGIQSSGDDLVSYADNDGIPVLFDGEALPHKSTRFMAITDAQKLPEQVYEIAEELQSWEFKFGKTPKFIHKFPEENVEFTVQKGRVEQVEGVLEAQKREIESKKPKYTAKEICAACDGMEFVSRVIP